MNTNKEEEGKKNRGRSLSTIVWYQLNCGLCLCYGLADTITAQVGKGIGRNTYYTHQTAFLLVQYDKIAATKNQAERI